MPEFVAPGVYVEEFDTGPKPIEGVSTSVAGFVGRTERGPEDIREITNWLEYQRWYGGHLGMDQSFLSYAVQGFFENGGQRCCIGRVVRNEAGQAEWTVGGIRIRAIGRGLWGGRVFVRFLPATGEPAGIRLRVLYFATLATGELPIDPDDAVPPAGHLCHPPEVIEEYDNAALDPGDPHSLIGSVNGTSRLVRLTVTTRKADDTVVVGGDRERTSFDVRSPSGISRSVIERTGDAWPKAVVVRLHLNGLENLKVSAGAVAVGAAAGVRDGKVEVRQWALGKDEAQLAPDDPRRLTIRVLGKDGKTAAGVPLDGGHFEVTLPPAFLRANPRSLTVEWVDFYRYIKPPGAARNRPSDFGDRRRHRPGEESRTRLSSP